MNEEVLIYDRYGRAIVREPVCGEWFLRFAYANAFGRCLQSTIGSRAFFSRIASFFVNRPASARKILPFVRRYGVSVSDCAKPLERYTTFQEFFTRYLRLGARPIDGGRGGIIAPADGRYLYIPNLRPKKTISVKNRRLQTSELLGNSSLAAKFDGGSALVCRLAPFDYHRFHFPCDVVPGEAIPLGRKLHSVHPLAMRFMPNTLFRNRRQLTRMAADCGEIAMVEVGATFVGSIRQTYPTNRHVRKGTEKGFFAFGGSTIILLFERAAVLPLPDIKIWSERGIETYVKMGDRVMERA
ncbi:MAG: archaetidylserine decarboxylase [Puniceicoccales bacterium]|jgi:phosphatidylserine decarboxylase|nr:archaetidylserine decarboxylase [Puniceicoccales bacterium]